MQFNTPLRYPGGKARLARYVMRILELNDLVGGDYIEPYAGGAAIGLTLLYLEYVDHFYLNDLNGAVYAFWFSVLNETENFCRLVRDTSVSLEERTRQKAVQRDTNSTLLELGFSTFFLNRVNRSGIISGGVIGGNDQCGAWKIDARYKIPDLLRRIEKAATYRKRISLSNRDACDFIASDLQRLPMQSLVYLDPPYYTKGKKLYQNHYRHADHEDVSRLTSRIRQKWIMSYDNTPAIHDLYEDRDSEVFGLSWSARERYDGSEVMIFGPDVSRPQKVETWRGIAA